MSDYRRRKLRRQVSLAEERHKQEQEWEEKRLYYVEHPVEFIENELWYHGRLVKLSPDQQKFIEEVASSTNFSVLMAGRGTGKTFSLACYCTWRITTHRYWGITYLGGAFEQAQILGRFIDGFVKESPWVRHYLDDNRKEWKGSTYLDTYLKISGCSETQTRGPHPSELVLDEEAAAEKAGNLGVVRAAIFQMMGGTHQPHIIKTSTAHYLLGDFMATWVDAEKLGYKRYRWSAAELVDGKWAPRRGCHWITQEQVDMALRQATEEEWDVEVMGGIGKLAGSVFGIEDIDRAVSLAVIDLALAKREEEGYGVVLLPDGENPVSPVYLGVDWGRNHPTVITIVQWVNNTVRVLHNEERFGERYEQIIEDIYKLYKKYHVDTVLPDPTGEMMNQKLQDKGMNIILINTVKENMSLFSNLVWLMQKGMFRIPPKYVQLIRELKMLSYDDKGNIRKQNDDHPDSLKLACSEYRYLRESEGGTAVGGVFKLY